MRSAEGERIDEVTDLTAEHPEPAIAVKQKKTAEELAAMILQDLRQIEGCPKSGLKVTVWFQPWSSRLTFAVEAGPGAKQGESTGVF